MRFAPTIHHSCLQIAPYIGSGFFRARFLSIPSLSFASSLRHASAFSSSISSVGSRRGGTRTLRMRHAKGTEQEGFSVSEEMAKTSSQSRDELNIDAKTASDPSSGGQQDSVTSSARTVALWVFAAVTFGIALGIKDGIEKASEYFAGYLLEQSLSVDNLFVFVLIFRYFKVPKMYERRVLTYGIAGAIIFRATMILLGAATLQRFEVVNLLLALILLFSSYQLFSAEEEETDLADNFIVKTCQKFIPVTAYYDGDRFLTLEAGVWKATPLLLTVAVIELSDIAFAVDSIPAVFGVTRDPFIVFSSNLFAISGLRSLYILISESMSELEYLQPAIGIVLGFLGTKMIFDFFGYHVPVEVSWGLLPQVSVPVCS
uniref:Thylakoid membrane protein TERC, chloroplastic n=1 Tax=Elaeis guineensis var. tenera TaxID=51953 RepID=A0A6J0PJH2_ELAGV|nr:thylakoid membrane protein TERC, chloroplastic [Elaeis guineensis]